VPGSPAVALRTCGHWPRRRRGQSSRYGKTKRGSPVKAARAFQDRTDPASLIRGAQSDVPYQNRHSQGSRRCPVGADVVLVNIDFCPLARVSPVRRKRRCPALASHQRRAIRQRSLRQITSSVANSHRPRRCPWISRWPACLTPGAATVAQKHPPHRPACSSCRRGSAAHGDRKPPYNQNLVVSRARDNKCASSKSSQHLTRLDQPGSPSAAAAGDQQHTRSGQPRVGPKTNNPAQGAGLSLCISSSSWSLHHRSLGDYPWSRDENVLTYSRLGSLRATCLSTFP
jgi:hypothetical protein